MNLSDSSQQPAASSQQPAAKNDRDPVEKFRAVVADIRDEYLSSAQTYPWIIGYSGGKDSTLVAHAIFEALLSIEPSRRTRPVHLVSNDTLVESPLVVAHLKQSQDAIAIASANLGLPVTVASTHPDIEQSFWVNLIGRGYPTPNQTMRWCTDRLKIQPTSRYILDFVSRCGAAIVVLGVRLDESQSRRTAINRRVNLADTNLTPHSELPGAFVYRPITELTTDEVWEILACHTPPWGKFVLTLSLCITVKQPASNSPVGCGERSEPHQPGTRGMMRFATLTTSYGSYFIERGGSYKAMTAEGQNKFALHPTLGRFTPRVDPALPRCRGRRVPHRAFQGGGPRLRNQLQPFRLLDSSRFDNVTKGVRTTTMSDKLSFWY